MCLFFLNSDFMMMMMNCFCGIVDLRIAGGRLSRRDHCQQASLSWLPNTLRWESIPDFWNSNLQFLLCYHYTTAWQNYTYSIHTVWKVSVFVVSLVSIYLTFGPNTEIRCISMYLVQMREDTDQKNSQYGNLSRSFRENVK